ncbi:uncharacterized protein IL334_000669 [Kwoniella shivajii]|uniref:G domain-containing protein n=1 Tax=Kwoniella shivajii TaxID=564305 RepID=A0ABZ1CPT1_9TREE|nr:hypothetical protein IL334_000669 [Kwoniella shivajii]
MSFLRPTFPYPARIPSWFAGHMSRSLRELPSLLENIDLVIEARDARLPLTSMNPTFETMLNRARKGKGKEREKVVVYTKRDLAEKRYEEPLKKAFLEHAGQRVMFADTRSDKDVKDILKYAVRIAKDNAETIPDLRVLVVGMPNVGKSSLLNALRRVGVRKGKAFRTGAEAGITRKLTGTVRIYDDPSVYVYDTPGVMLPFLGRGEDGAEKGLKLALTAGIKESLFEQDAMVDYLLWKMNKRLIIESELLDDDPNKHQSYLSLLPLPKDFEPTDHLPTLLDALSDRLGALKKGGERDHEAASAFLIRSFREGKLGGYTLDDLILPINQLAPTPTSHEDEGNGDHLLNTLSIPSNDTVYPPSFSEVESIPAPISIPQSGNLDYQVSQAVKAYLSQSKETNPSISSDSLNQQKKANKRVKLEERDAKLRAKGVNVPVRQWGERNSKLSKKSRSGEAGKFARSRR